MRSLVIGLGLLVAQTAFAGRGGSTTLIESAVRSGSVDAIIAEVERAEELACLSCIDPVRQLVDHPSARVRDVAGWWLSKRGVRTQVIADMTARLQAQDPLAARNAADVLAAMRDFTTLPALAAYLKQPLDEQSGISAARAIGAIGHPQGLSALAGAFGSPLVGVRAAALEAMRNLRAPIGQTVVSDSQLVLPLLTDGNESVRRQAALTAGFLRDRAAVTALSQVALTDASARVRKSAAWALGEIGDSGAASALTAASSDGDPFVRSVATAALGRLK
jgi:HEAT repeat protein